ncbi:MFS transporter [Kitasatospora sp. NPDC058444]|uniref:MFS transporter n=1 Tax=Kitasatospora sp. NPDC058444 TaxID=3346504 RepID=UPI00366099C7
MTRSRTGGGEPPQAVGTETPIAGGAERESGAAGEPSIFGNRNFRRLFTANTVSLYGSQVSYLAVPLTAVTVLDASPAQVGLLGVLSTVSFLLVGLPAGVWVDRMPRRPIMFTADFGRALLLGSIPVAWLLGALTLTQLYVVVFVSGTLTVFSDISAQSFLPSIVQRERLLQANGYIGSVRESSGVAGPSLGGLLLQLMAAPVAVVVDAFGFLLSGLLISRIDRVDESHTVAEKKALYRGIWDGVRFVFSHPLLRPIATAGAITNFSLQMVTIMLPLLFEQVLHLSAWRLGLYLAVGGIGSLIGAYTGPRLAERVGQGRVLWLAGLVTAPFAGLVPLIGDGAMYWVSAVCWLVVTYRMGMNSVVLVSFRQRVTPNELLGRMNATMRFALTGATALGAGASGLVGQFFGVRASLYVGAVGLAVAWLPYVFSPLRRMRTLP